MAVPGWISSMVAKWSCVCLFATRVLHKQKQCEKGCWNSSCWKKGDWHQILWWSRRAGRPRRWWRLACQTMEWDRLQSVRSEPFSVLWSLSFHLLKCCFTSTETIRLTWYCYRFKVIFPFCLTKWTVERTTVDTAATPSCRASCQPPGGHQVIFTAEDRHFFTVFNHSMMDMDDEE